ncbi:DUF2206 domain-containing protein [Haloprofundus halobius]|uniref:DUF2206 domain-containing protein n=1 Tax=Haloprofundus halobius TaxID=2876194 RepID=UPI001CCB61DF|nr:DUF2206 domain-containing protein [Haloprofundus halobius]
MAQNISQTEMQVAWSPIAIVTVVGGLLVAFWASTLVSASTPVFSGVRVLTASLLFLFFPGALVIRLLDLRVRSFGPFVVLSVGLSFAILSAVTITTSVALPALGVTAPLALVPLGVVLSLVVAGLVALVSSTDTELPRLNTDFGVSTPVLALVTFLPTVAAVATILMDSSGNNAGMFLFVVATAFVAVLASVRHLPSTFYPLTVFSVALSMVLHRSLLTDHVVGADIQNTFFVSSVIGRAGVWSPEINGTSMAVPMMTSVPVSVTVLTGIGLPTTFKVTYALLFALVPVGMYYIAREVFDSNIALFGSLFISFYHLSFYFTPGKQLVSQLFVVGLMLLYVRTRLATTGSKAAAVLLAVGLVHSHYAVTYVLGISLLVAVTGLFLTRRIVGKFDHGLSFSYPLILLGGATAWYVYSSQELVSTLASIPISLRDQIITLLLTGIVQGSGSSYVAGPSTYLDDLRLLLYVVFSLLLTVGLARHALTQLRQIWDGEAPDYVEYTALAVPLLVFLCSAYFFTINLWADRAYQLVLVVLAPFMPLGYRILVEDFNTVRSAISSRDFSPERASIGRGSWTVLAVLLAVLLAFNSGMVFAVAGPAQTASFNPEAHDYAFSEDERAGANWLLVNTNITETEAYTPDQTDNSDEVPVFTDSVSSQMFRSELPDSYYTSETIDLKDRWDPQLDLDRVDRGYVYLRHRSVVDVDPDEPVSTDHLSKANETVITSTHHVVYSNGNASVVKVQPEMVGNETQPWNDSSNVSPPPAELTAAETTRSDVSHARHSNGGSRR